VKKTAEERFWEKVKKSVDGCWTWTAGTSKNFGYGWFRSGTGEPVHAHRFSWEIHYGPIPENQCVLHSCDNPLCVRPDHLFLGNRTKNAADRDGKGRGRNARGEDHGKAKLTEDDVRAIRKEYSEGSCGYRKLSKQYGVSRQSIQAIIKRNH
jgi:hypothetical protein